MFHVIAAAIWFVLAWRFGDWRNWRKYHATLLFIITSDLLQNILLYRHPLWTYTPAWPLPNHTFVNLLVMFVIYPSVLLIYLPRYPSGFKQIPYVLFWSGLWWGVEWVLVRYHYIVHSYGWTLFDSFLFDMLIFVVVRLHFKKPLWAYALTFCVAVIVLTAFHVGPDQMR